MSQLICPVTNESVAGCKCGRTHLCPVCKKLLSDDGLCCDPYDTRDYVALISPFKSAAETLHYRRAEFVYEAARLAAIAARAPIVPAPFAEREKDFVDQFLGVIERQCGPERSYSPERLHESWMQAYFTNGWTYGDQYDSEARTHPDLVPYDQLGQLEQDKDSVFVALCDIARQWVRE